MANAAQIVAAFRDVAATKSLSDEEMTDLVKDGILAGLARIYGPTVRAEIDIDEVTGEFDMRMSGTGPSAADVVNAASEHDLANIIYLLGEEQSG